MDIRKRIPFITPHQLSSEAKKLLREDRPDFVKVIAEKGYWDGCTRLDQELDLELYIHIEKLNKKSYLTVQRGKHRLPTVIPESKKYIVLPFMEAGGIMDDFGKERIGSTRVGGGPVGSGEEVPWWEANNQV